MVKTKYVNKVYRKFKDIVDSLAMWDNKKFMYVSVDYVIYEMCDIPKNISREDILKEVIPKLNKKKIRLDSSTDNKIYSLSWYEMSITKIKLKFYIKDFLRKYCAELLSLNMISLTLILGLSMRFVIITFGTNYMIVALGTFVIGMAFGVIESIIFEIMFDWIC